MQSSLIDGINDSLLLACADALVAAVAAPALLGTDKTDDHSSRTGVNVVGAYT